MLEQAQVEIIKATAPVVGAHAREITEHFYPLMFERYPEVKAYFNQAHQEKGTQRQALANAVVAYATNIENLQVLGNAVNLIAHKHCSLNIRPEQYPVVGECLLDSIRAVLGEAATPEIIDAWAAAYGQLAEILINAEEQIYHDNAARAGGWRGERLFRVVKKVRESEVITSFHLAPADADTDDLAFTPGQYVGLVLDIDGQIVRRNYSVSQAPGQPTLRISVKREPGGLVSNHLHDRVGEGDSITLTAPCGDFVLRSADRPLFLITAGVGITPAISMLDAALAEGREVVFVHAAQNSAVHAFREHVDQLVARHNTLQVRYVYDQPLPGDEPHLRGLVTRELLAGLMPADRDVDAYFLGPRPFMVQVNAILGELGVPAHQVRYEFFGPLESLDAA